MSTEHSTPNIEHRTPNMRITIFLWTGCWLLGTAPVLAGIPQLIRYQGQAVDSKNVSLEGPYTLTFRLYDAETAGTKLWEEKQVNVPLTNGYFSVLLGQVTSLSSIDWSAPCWLSVQVNTDPELAPRQRITSVPLAIRAERAEQLTNPITPTLITPQGSGSGLDADTVDGRHATDLLNRANHTGTQPSSTITGTFPSSTITGTFPPSSISPQGAGSGLDADTVDGMHASQLVTPRGPAIYLCPPPPPNPCGRFCTVTYTDCYAQLTTSSTCSVVTSTGGSGLTPCNPVGYLMPQ